MLKLAALSLTVLCATALMFTADALSTPTHVQRDGGPEMWQIKTESDLSDVLVNRILSELKNLKGVHSVGEEGKLIVFYTSGVNRVTRGDVYDALDRAAINIEIKSMLHYAY
jgi:hypothetical protein